MNISDAIRISDAAKLYGCSLPLMYRFVREGKLPITKVLNVRTVNRQQVIALSQANKTKRDRWRNGLMRNFLKTGAR